MLYDALMPHYGLFAYLMMHISYKNNNIVENKQQSPIKTK
jgi:hypothetical protein